MFSFDIESFISLNEIEKKNIYKKLAKIFPEEILNTYFEYAYFSDEITIPSSVTNNEMNLAYQLFTKDKFKNSENLIEFKKLITSLALVDDALKPIAGLLHIEYEIGIVGGALRDLLLNRKNLIKDIDIVFSLIDIKGFKKKQWMSESEKCIQEELKEKIKELGEDSIELKKWKEDNIGSFNMDIIFYKLKDLTKEWGIEEFKYNEEKKTTWVEQCFFHIVSELLKKQFTIDKNYEPRELPKELSQTMDAQIWRSGYHNALLRGVIKVSSPTLPYPVDVLLCNKPIKEYLNTFDFEICKAWLIYNQDTSKELESLLNFFTLDKLEYAYDKIGVSTGFIKDELNKTLTINPFGFDLNAVEQALIKHYPRVKAKFSDYSLEMNINEKNHIEKEIKQYIETFILYEKFNGIIPDKKHSQEIKEEVKAKL